jgi:hypothetical protein
MHAAHFHPLRAVTVTVIAALLPIVIALAIASRVHDGQRQPRAGATWMRMSSMRWAL